MRRNLRLWICLFAMSFATLFGQGPTLTGTGYADPSVIKVAPGQITTLYVTGLKTVLSVQPVNATSLPLPTTLAGISVTLNQTGTQPSPIPLLSVQQVSVCSTGSASPPLSPTSLSPDCLITAITVQIPFELSLVPNHEFPPPYITALVLTENGNVSKSFKVVPMTDNLHVMNTCDAFPPPNVTQPTSSTLPCYPLVTHANGDLITADDPAQPGEEIVIWAFGLGLTNPIPKTGTASPSPAATLASFLYFQFDFRVNATPSRPYINPLILTPIQAPIFAGSTPGQVGLYQVTLRVPNPATPIANCTPGTQTLPPYNTVFSNLTIDLGAPASFDGAAICVAAGVQALMPVSPDLALVGTGSVK
jgi:hypothetical protein